MNLANDIIWWLEANQETTKIAILDDDIRADIGHQYFADSFFHINTNIGLTEVDVEAVIAHLGAKDA